MRFTKMHGLGNDYVYVNCFTEPVTDPPALARLVSDRHFGIGSDGLILIKPSGAADFQMDMYNADGSQGAMCGNGIRCVGKYVYDHGMTDRTQLRIETKSGIKTLALTVTDGAVSEVCVDMGAPILEAERIPVNRSALEGQEREHCTGKMLMREEAGSSREQSAQTGAGHSKELSAQTEAGHSREQSAQARNGSSAELSAQAACSADVCVVDRPIRAAGSWYRATCVSMGNPHCVVPVEDVDGLAIETIGPAFEHHAAFPDRVNTEFIRVLDRSTIQMRVWERGSGETFACGTGACAAAVEVTVRLRGGDLRICWDEEQNTVFMTGPAVTVFEGEFLL